MAKTWIEALKKFNEGKAQYTIPKRGTAEHAEVSKIHAGIKSSAAQPSAPVEPEVTNGASQTE